MRKNKKFEPPKPLPEYLTKQYIANYLHCSTKTVERMFADGLESFKLRGKRYVTRENLTDFISRSASA
jgi:hypothetical protein